MKEKIKREIPELPQKRRERYLQLDLSQNDVEIIVSEKELSDFFDKALELYGNPKNLVNWLSVEILSFINENKIDFKNLNIDVCKFVKIIELVDKNEITRQVAKDILKRYLNTGEDPLLIIEKEGLRTVSDFDYLHEIIKKVIINNEKAVTDWKKGKTQVINFLVGQVMKETKGRASLDIVKTLLEEELNKL